MENTAMAGFHDKPISRIKQVYFAVCCVIMWSRCNSQIFIINAPEVNNNVEQDTPFSFASYYSSHMVLQMSPDQAFIWGYGIPSGDVIVEVDGNTVNVTVDARGIWGTSLEPHEAGGPHTIVAMHTYNNEDSILELKDIYFGDVWVCSGQSNMVMSLNMVYNASEEFTRAVNYTQIRLFKVGESYSETESLDLALVNRTWSQPSNDSLGANQTWEGFSALCFLFGRHLYDAFKVPIGLVESAVGGTVIEAWSSDRVIKECGVPTQNKSIPLHRNMSSVLWNAMIHPLVNMTIRGIIWYQGEANIMKNSLLYSCTFPAMVADWRRVWKPLDGSIVPFGFVQLAPFNQSRLPHPLPGLPDMRWHQTADLGYVPNALLPDVFMAAALDLPDNRSPFGSIHPRDKQTIAQRLFWAAMNVVYRNSSYPTIGPMVVQFFTQRNDTSRLMILTYNKIIQVHTRNGFSALCDDTWKDITIVKWDDQTVTLDVTDCNPIVVLRYLWKDMPCSYKHCAIYSDDEYQLPAPTWLWKL